MWNNLEMGFFVDKKGRRTQIDRIFYWRGAPFYFRKWFPSYLIQTKEYEEPYLLCFGKETLEIYDIVKGELMQGMTLPQLKAIDSNLFGLVDDVSGGLKIVHWKQISFVESSKDHLNK